MKRIYGAYPTAKWNKLETIVSDVIDNLHLANRSTLYVSIISLTFSQVIDFKWGGNRLSLRKFAKTEPSSSPFK